MAVRRASPSLFRDGDLAIVTPDAPAAIAEVKTSPTGAAEWDKIALKMARHGVISQRIAGHVPWLGIFSFEGDDRQLDHALNAVCFAHEETGIAINCVGIGNSAFLRYWPLGQTEQGDPDVNFDHEYWRSYHLDRLAASYFIGNLVDGVCSVKNYAWFAYRDGKGPHIIREQPVAESRAKKRSKKRGSR